MLRIPLFIKKLTNDASPAWEEEQAKRAATLVTQEDIPSLEEARDAAIAEAGKTTLADAEASDTLPPAAQSAWPSLLQAVRNYLKFVKGNALFKSETAGFVKNDGTTGYPTAANVGLGNVTNTSDEDKPVSTAQQAAIETAVSGKLDKAGGAMTGDLDMGGKSLTNTQSVGTSFITPAEPDTDDTVKVWANLDMDGNAVRNLPAPDDEGDAANRKYVDDTVAEAQLATHTWLPAVHNKADLPAPSTLTATLNYLCRVIADSTAANNGVWELVAGADEWTYFSDNQDWVDETELAAAVEEHNEDDGAHSGLFGGKVDKVSGKGLSTEDYTAAEKTKLAGIAEGAQANAVTSVAGKTGAVTLAAANVGLGNVTNTSDEDKPVSTAQQTALNKKAYIQNSVAGNTEILIPDWIYGDKAMHNLLVCWCKGEYGGTIYWAQYAIRMWSGGNSTSWSVWNTKIGGTGTLAFSNGGAKTLKIVPSPLEEGKAFNYSVMWS